MGGPVTHHKAKDKRGDKRDAGDSLQHQSFNVNFAFTGHISSLERIAMFTLLLSAELTGYVA